MTFSAWILACLARPSVEHSVEVVHSSTASLRVEWQILECQLWYALKDKKLHISK